MVILFWMYTISFKYHFEEYIYFIAAYLYVIATKSFWFVAAEGSISLVNYLTFNTFKCVAALMWDHFKIKCNIIDDLSTVK